MTKFPAAPIEPWEQIATLIGMGYRHIDAYRQVYPNANDQTARKAVHQLVKREDVQARIAQVEAARKDVTKPKAKYTLEYIQDGLNSEATNPDNDGGTRVKAWVALAQVSGMMKPDVKGGDTYNFTKQEVMVIGLVGDPEARRALDVLAERLEGQPGGNGG